MSKFKQSKVYNFFINHSIILMTVQLLIVVAVTMMSLHLFSELLLFIKNLFGLHYKYYAISLVTEITAYITTLALAFLLGYRRLYKRAIVNFRTVWLTGVYVLLWSSFIIVLSWTNSYLSHGRPKKALTEIICAILTFVFVGLFEEMFARGLLLNICLKHLPKRTSSMWLAIIISSVLFGLSHMNNLVTGASLKGILIQVIYATEVGVFLGAVYLRTGSLLWCSFLHGFYDIACSIEQLFFYNYDMGEVISSYSWMSVVVLFPFLVIGIFLLRKGFASTYGIEDNKLSHKVAFVLTLIICIGAIVFCVGLYYYVDGLSVSDYIEFKKRYHVTY